MTGLLDLPSELLFRIIHLVLLSPYHISPNGQRHRPEWKPASRNVTCFPSPGILWSPNALSLLLANQRLYSETMLYLSKKPQSFKIDLALVDNHWLWPTWRTIPIRNGSTVIDSLEIELIPCYTKDDRLFYQTEMSLESEQAAISELVSLLRHFILLEGPLVTHMNTLWVNIDTSRYKSGKEIITKEEVPLRRISDLAHLGFDTLYPITKDNVVGMKLELYSRMKDMLNDLRLLPENELPSQRIDTVFLCVDGKVSLPIDVASHMGVDPEP